MWLNIGLFLRDHIEFNFENFFFLFINKQQKQQQNILFKKRNQTFQLKEEEEEEDFHIFILLSLKLPLINIPLFVSTKALTSLC